MKKRPTGADNFLKLRRSIDEHLELRRITWDEFGMFSLALREGEPAHRHDPHEAGRR